MSEGLERELARVVADEIKAVEGRWPTSREAWQRVAERFGMTVEFYAEIKPEDACIIRHVLHVPDPDDGVGLDHSVFAHELAEAVMLWDGREPYACPPEKEPFLRHRVAKIVEELR